ncbi:hypothetical protein ElyMa_000115500 [Elysia marginata]|uniref:Uncharacterized protein n=1 Tax=Elysia marginata TaxID=1093978 RepID=A0AAV4EN71_9GAST|nr:hypothetical protein ElyMa_000115500 [Elysia marginata]
MSKTGRGILLEVDTRMDEKRLMRVSELAGIKVKVTRDGYLNTSRGVVKDRDLNLKDVKQARAAAVVNVAKEIRPKLFTQVVRGTSTRAATTSATVKESVGVPSQVSATARDGPGRKNIRTDRSNNKNKSEETRKPQTCGRYGADPEVDLDSIDSI